MSPSSSRRGRPSCWRRGQRRESRWTAGLKTLFQSCCSPAGGLAGGGFRNHATTSNRRKPIPEPSELTLTSGFPSVHFESRDCQKPPPAGGSAARLGMTADIWAQQTATKISFGRARRQTAGWGGDALRTCPAVKRSARLTVFGCGESRRPVPSRSAISSGGGGITSGRFKWSGINRIEWLAFVHFNWSHPMTEVADLQSALGLSAHRDCSCVRGPDRRSKGGWPSDHGPSGWEPQCQPCCK